MVRNNIYLPIKVIELVKSTNKIQAVERLNVLSHEAITFVPGSVITFTVGQFVTKGGSNLFCSTFQTLYFD